MRYGLPTPRFFSVSHLQYSSGIQGKIAYPWRWKWFACFQLVLVLRRPLAYRGVGLFAGRDFEIGEKVAFFDGRIVYDQNARRLDVSEKSYVLSLRKAGLPDVYKYFCLKNPTKKQGLGAI